MARSGNSTYLPNGSIRATNGVIYARTSRRVTRQIARELLSGGAAVATDIYPDGLNFFERDSALAEWQAISPGLVVGKVPPVKHDVLWVGHVWQSESGEVLLHFAGRH